MLNANLAINSKRTLQSDFVPAIKAATMRTKPTPDAIISWLRQFPRVYNIARCLRRNAENLILSFLRKAFPASSRLGPPKGFFSEYDLLKQNKLRGRILFASQPVPPVGPDEACAGCAVCARMNTSRGPRFGPIIRQPGWLAKRWCVSMSKNSCSPGRRLRRNLRAGRPCLPNRLPAGRQNSRRQLDLPGAPMEQWILPLVHGHALPFGHAAGIARRYSRDRAGASGSVPILWQDTLRWLGLENRIRPTAERHLLVEHYYYCSATAMTGCYDPSAVEFLRRSLLSRADVTYQAPRRFYLRRVGKTRPILNEKEILDYFALLGWEIIDTEQMPLARQIQLFAQAEMICAPHGAGLTNLLWCRPGCKVLELFPSTFLNGVYEGLAECVGANYRFLVFAGDQEYRSCVDLQVMKKALEF